MKNIHVLPTENESRIRYNSFNKVYELCEFPKYHTDIKSAHNIYITSDEEIEDGDWVYFISTNEVIKVPLGGFKGKVCKKIILTTDQYLIKDGVQAIDDAFLEWFVKNPSCEEVETDKYPRFDLGKGEYKIIIPKEELTYTEAVKKEERIFNSNITKQKTLDKAAAKWVLKTNSHRWSNNDDTAWDNYNSFKEGAKWQAERMYSDEEVLDLLCARNIEFNLYEGRDKVEEWFEQFKNKSK